MSCEWIKAEKDEDGTVQLTLARPEKRNALNKEMITAINEHLLQWYEDDSIRLLSIDAEGRFFSAGADLKWMQQSANATFNENMADAQLLGTLYELLYHFPKPVICMVNGPAYGGALGIVAASDIVICTPSALFCLSEVKLGLIPAVISPYLVEAIGLQQARRFALSAELISAEKAHDIGLVHKITEQENFLTRKKELEKQLYKGSPDAQAQTKALLRYVHGKPIDKNLIQHTIKTIAQIRTQPSGKEGISAFLEKRKPDWEL